MPASRDDVTRPSWASALRTLRLGVRLTQPEAASAANPFLPPSDKPITQQDVSRIEQGGQFPDDAVVTALCRAYGAPAQAAEIEAAVREARERRSDRRLVVQRGNTLTEGSLRVQLGSPELMAEQLDALRTVCGVPHVDLRILPMQQAVAEPLTGGGFHIYDDVVVLGLEVASADMNDPADVDYFRRLFEQYHQASVGGRAATDLIGELAEGYRALLLPH